MWLSSFGRIYQGEFPTVTIGGLQGSVLPYGNGRSYGDSCLPKRTGSAVVSAEAEAPSFNPETGVLVASSGMILSHIILSYGPLGWFLPVTPGTKHVTLGGAIGNDVHGKNHHVRGTFGCHIDWLDLLRSDGTVYRCSTSENADLFAATIGGMGLTGYIMRAALRLMKVPGVNVADRTIPFGSLDAYFEQADAVDAGNEYAVAWIDQLATGKSSGRGLLFAGNHVESDFAPHKQAKISVPFVPPISVLNGFTVRAFNTAYRIGKSRNLNSKTAHYDPFFYPLDMVGNWNRLYGPRGLHQHQSIIPFDAAREVVPRMLEESRRAGQVSFLTVIKWFGDTASPGLLSFPVPGYTLTLDFPHKGASTLALLDMLDRITLDCGGRVNPYKDSRMSAQTFAQSFPHWRRLENLRDPAFMSGFWQRTAMQL